MEPISFPHLEKTGQHLEKTGQQYHLVHWFEEENVQQGKDVFLNLCLEKTTSSLEKNVSLEKISFGTDREDKGSWIYLQIRNISGFRVIDDSLSKIPMTGGLKTKTIQFQLSPENWGIGKLEILVFSPNHEQLALIKIQKEICSSKDFDSRPQRKKKKRKGRQQEVFIPERKKEYALTLIERSQENSLLLSGVIWGEGSLEEQIYLQFERNLGTTPLQFLEGVTKQLSDLAISKAPAENRENQLWAISMELTHTLLDESTREWLEKHQEQIVSIHIISEEHWIPWELARLKNSFWGEKFGLTRGIPSQTLPLEFSLQSTALLSSQQKSFSWIEKEKKQLSSLFKNSRGNALENIPVRSSSLKEEGDKGKHTAWYITGQKTEFDIRYPMHPSWVLEDGGTLTPTQLVLDEWKGLGEKSPFFFMNFSKKESENDCTLALTGASIWGKSFVARGASAFIVPLWHITEEKAVAFAQVVFEFLFDGIELGQAVRMAKKMLREKGSFEELAYLSFAHPKARISARRNISKINPNFHSGARLKLALSLLGKSREDILEDSSFPQVDESTLRRWIRKGIPKKRVQALAEFFQLESWIFLSPQVSPHQFQEMVLNPSIQGEIKAALS